MNKRGPRAGLRRSTKKNESVRSLVNAILSTSNPFAIPENLEDVRKMLVDLANFARSLDRRLAETRSDPPTREDSDYEVVLNASLEGKQQGIQDSIDSITEDFQKVMIDIDSAHRHFGKSSNWIWVQSALDFRRDELGARSLTGAAWAKYHRPWMWKAAPWQKKTEMLALPDLVFPDGGLLAELIGLYFDNINQFSPLLHRPTFEGAVMDQLHLQDRSFGLLVLSVCALGSRHSSDPRNLCSGRYAEFSQGWKWFCQIPLIRPSLTEPPTLYDLQICILSAFYLQTTALNEAAWTTIGFGIRCVHEIGVHRRKPGHRKHTIEDELWKRAFWILVSTDLILSLFQGRPRATTPDDFDIDLPAECDDEYWESVGSGKPFVQPRGKPSTTSYFVTLLKLLDILSLVERTLLRALSQTDDWAVYCQKNRPLGEHIRPRLEERSSV
ncbi:Gypsy retrotransposon integrase-like protein 1 [Paramarasmius palmivorus]|uniref:Gypsy retrotransposon integrase-like protein 1 n=1 Tax=Paramarasmius palmivorus TaxID=297713 RepID=A0AAW0CXN6_9AGAR